jgi:hypothetical protein
VISWNAWRTPESLICWPFSRRGGSPSQAPDTATQSAEPPIEPLILGLILGGRMESAYRQSLIISKGSVSIFLTKPISLALLLVAVLFLALPPLIAWSKRRKVFQPGINFSG